MFGKKKSEPAMCQADCEMGNLYSELSNALTALWRQAKQTYIKAEALKVYSLATPDGESAQKDLEAAKHSLRCLIGRYDSAVSEIKRHYAEHHEEMQRNWNTNFCTSHEQIEFAIREVLKEN